MTQANPVEFTAKPTLNGNKVKWELCHTNPPKAPIPNCGTSNGSYPNVELPPGTAPYVFKYQIVNDQTGKGIKFADGALVIKKGEPFGPGKEKQIGDVVKGGGNKMLTFVDRNSLPNSNDPDPVVITYGLHFTDQAGVAVTSIDPDITNGGNPGVIVPPPGAGPGGRAEWNYADHVPAFALGLLAGIIMMLLFQHFRRAG